MKISLEKAVEALSEFMTEQVNTITDQFKRAIGLMFVGGIAKNPEGILAKARPWLEMSGILSDNVVDVDVLKAGLDNAFSSVPKVSYLGFGFNSGDAANLVSKMQAKVAPEQPASTEVPA